MALAIERDVDEKPADPAAAMLDDQPGVNEGAVGEHAAELERRRNLRDKHGRKFNADWHAVGDDGLPELTKRGGLLKIRQGTYQRTSKSNTPSGQPSAAGPAPQLGPSSEDVAIVLVDTITGVASMMFGEHWRPVRQLDDDGVTVVHDERVQMIAAWDAYLAKQGVTEIKPEYIVALTMAGYAAPRLSHRDTRSKLRNAASVARDRVRGWGARFRRNQGDGAQADSRTDGNGKEHVRDEHQREPRT